MQIFPAPPIRPFQRLHVSEGLLITTERWKQTQRYHRQRQNFQFQALFQPGIICGLGVSVVSTNFDDNTRYEDGRRLLLQVQPGMAIDVAGNPIIVPQPEVFQLRSKPAFGRPEIVYLAINYVDPDELRYDANNSNVQETFRIIEKNALAPEDVELCRILFDGSDVSLAADPCFPTLNTLDHRHRLPVRQRPQGSFRLAQLVSELSDDSKIQASLSRLVQSVDVLCPSFQALKDIAAINCDSLGELEGNSYDLLYCPYDYVSQIPPTAYPYLKRHLDDHGLLCIHADMGSTRLHELYAIRQELLVALADLDDPSEQGQRQLSSKAQAIEEVNAIEADIESSIAHVRQGVVDLAQRLQYPLPGDGTLDPEHPLLTYPFLFGQLPTINAQPIYGFCWGSVVLLISHLPEAWRADVSLDLSRNQIRTAQEFGINLLHFSWRRRQLSQLQGAQSSVDPPPPSGSLTQQVT
ncbi:MAG: hypothetical protein AAFY17_16030 [Cyanobacteria bacterium J06642_11]